MSYERQLPGEPLNIGELVDYAADIHKIYRNGWLELLRYPEVAEQLIDEIRTKANILLGGWVCAFISSEAYRLGEGSVSEPVDDTTLCYVGQLKNVEPCEILNTGVGQDDFGSPVSISLVFEPSRLDFPTILDSSAREELPEVIRLVSLPEDIAVPLLPRTSSIDPSGHLSVCRMQAVH